jgi:twinkle protein
MAELPHQPCPYEGCYSTDAFSYNTNGYGKCHSCSRDYPTCKDTLIVWAKEKYPTVYSMKHQEERVAVNSSTTSTMTKLSVVENLLTPVIRGYRDINKDVMAYYNVTTYVDANGEPVKQDYIYPAGGKKVRTLPKSFRAEGGFKGDELFGMDKFNAGCAKAVTITEGELDALSAYQMLGSKYPVVSLPSATPSGKLFEKCKDWLGSFEKIYLSFDSDGKSDGVAHKLANIFPNRVYNVPHDKYKDANEFLQAGAS